MAQNEQERRTSARLELLSNLGSQYGRIITVEQARQDAAEFGLSENYVRQAFHHLERAGWITRLKRGMYALTSPLFAPPEPLHEFEIAMHLVEPAAISHWTAMHYHGLTEQIPRTVYILTTETWRPRRKGSKNPRVYTVDGHNYEFVQVKQERFFGIDSIWIGNQNHFRVKITDRERTLIDGLIRPQYCGDFGDVIEAIHDHADQLNLDLMIDYALQIDAATCKRLGWILSQAMPNAPLLDRLRKVDVAGYVPLDPTGPKKGRCNNEWHIQENLSGRL
jgi:predicted transcriptional regulator of viral defense system